MSHFLRFRILAGAVAIACVSVLSGCYHRHDAVYVDRVHVDEHRDHHDEHRDDRR